jgi:hypothetical protein
MKREDSRRRGWFVSLTLTILMVFMGLNPAKAQEILTTQYAVVQANAAADLLDMERRLRFAATFPAGPLPVTGSFAFHPGYARLASKIDGIILRVATLLGVPPSRSYRVNLVLLPTGREVRQQHVSLVPGQRPGLFGYGSLEAFYYTGNRTVYLSLADLREGILAHEITHYILCTAVAPSPSAELQEKYAHYVESRL